MEHKSQLRLALLCTAVTVWAPLAAHAQSAPIASAPNAQSSTLQEVTVTASRRAKSLQKTAITVTVVSGTTIQRQGLVNLTDIVQNIPDVTVKQQQRGYSVSIRGQGTDLPPGSGQGEVAVEQDGIYNIRAESGVVGYYDLARVEALAGPQGTLYGVNSDGGVVNVITNDPVLGQYHVSASAQIGNYHLFRGEAMVNIPINPVLAFRLAGAAINRASYIEPAQGDAVSQAVRAKLLYQPFPNLSVLIGYELNHIGGLGTNSSVSGYPNGVVNNLKNPWDTGTFSTTGPQPSNTEEHQYDAMYHGVITYGLDDIAVLNVLPAYSRDRDKDQLCGPSGPPGSPPAPGVCNINKDPTLLEQFSSEERITSAPGSAISWDFGAYHWNYRQKSSGGGPHGSYVGQTSNAAFAELTYSVLPTLRLIGGVRESWDHKFSWEQNATGQEYVDAADFSHFDYRAGVEFDAAPASMEYFTVSTGYRPGGINAPATATSAPTTFRTEQVTSFEFGSKNRFLNNTLQLNGDVFYYIQKNYQVNDFFQNDNPACQGPPGSNLPAFCSSPTLNIQAHVLGVEIQSRYNITADDQINISGAYLNAKFNSQSGPCINPALLVDNNGVPLPGANDTSCLVAGNTPAAISPTNQNGEVVQVVSNFTQPHAPQGTVNASYQHTWELATGATVTAAAQLFASSGYYVDVIENPYSYQPSYWTQQLNAAYQAPSGNWNLNAYIHNLSNYAVKEASIPGNIGEPRTYGVTGNWHF